MISSIPNIGCWMACSISTTLMRNRLKAFREMPLFRNPIRRAPLIRRPQHQVRRPPAAWETSKLGDDHETMHCFFKLWVGANGRHLYKVTRLASLFGATRCGLLLFLLLFSFRRFSFFPWAMMERLSIICASKASGRGHVFPDPRDVLIPFSLLPQFALQLQVICSLHGGYCYWYYFSPPRAAFFTDGKKNNLLVIGSRGLNKEPREPKK